MIIPSRTAKCAGRIDSLRCAEGIHHTRRVSNRAVSIAVLGAPSVAASSMTDP